MLIYPQAKGRTRRTRTQRQNLGHIYRLDNNELIDANLTAIIK
jgi:hypothetical protein